MSNVVKKSLSLKSWYFFEFSVFKQEYFYLLSFVETSRKFIIAELSIRKLGSSSVLIIIGIFLCVSLCL